MKILFYISNTLLGLLIIGVILSIIKSHIIISDVLILLIIGTGLGLFSYNIKNGTLSYKKIEAFLESSFIKIGSISVLLIKIIFGIGAIYFLIIWLQNNKNDDWRCIEDGTAMYSMNSKGNLGSADKGCSCEQIYNFELKTFGEVDIDALKSDFGCNF